MRFAPPGAKADGDYGFQKAVPLLRRFGDSEHRSQDGPQPRAVLCAAKHDEGVYCLHALT